MDDNADFDDPRKKIDELINKKEPVAEFVPFDSPQEKIKKAEHKHDLELGKKFKSAEAQRVFDNVKFADEVESNPVLSKDYDRKVFGYEMISFNHYLNQRIWPRSIYTTDKLVRLAMSAKLEFLKRYLSKKRHVPMSMIWLLILMFAVGAVILVIMFLILPLMGL